MKLLKRLFQFYSKKVLIPQLELPYNWLRGHHSLNKEASSQGLTAKQILKHLVKEKSKTTIPAIEQAKALLLTLRTAAINKDPLSPFWVHKSLLRATILLQQNLFTAYQQYQTPEDNIWLALHQSYLLAESLHLEQLQQQSRFIRKKASIQTLYAECILLALANPYHLGLKDFRTSVCLIKTAAPFLQITQRHTESEGIYIDSYHDTPPYHAQKLSLAGQNKEFIVKLDNALAQLEAMGIAPELNTNEKQSLIQLARQWQNPATRDFPRIPAQEPLSFCFGIEDLHACLSQPQKTNRLQAHSVINVSPGGLCIAIKSYDSITLGINELVGIFPLDESHDAEPLLGVVRWVKQEKDQRLLGIQALATNPLPLPRGAIIASAANKALLLRHKQGTQLIRSIICSELPKKSLLSIQDEEKPNHFRTATHLETFGKLHHYEIVPAS